MRKALLCVLAAATLAAVPAAAGRTDAPAASSQRYVVVFNSPNGIPATAEQAIAKAGGTIVTRVEQVGAAGVESSNPAFLDEIRKSSQVKDADPDISIQWLPNQDTVSMDVGASSSDNNGGTESPTGPDPQPMPDNLGQQQWDKMRMNATLTGSYALQQGRKDVVVAVLDTGADVLPTPHIDIAPNLDYARSAAFVDKTGLVTLPAPDNNPVMWDDVHGHGSWCLSAVAAPINTIGVSGVAPNVTLVALKVLGDTGSGTFLGVANALVYSGDQGFDIASMSLGAYYNHSEYNALYVLMNRAIQYARSKGVTPIAAMGNDGLDLSDGNLMRDWIESPGEHPGVIGVSATGYYDQKAFYSNYGVDAVDVAAPGGSTRNYDGVPGSGAAPGYNGLGRVIGAWSQEGVGAFPPVLREEQCYGEGGTTTCSYYAWVQGTSMATPNAAGVAALIISQYGKPDLRPTQVESYLQISANNRPCPEPPTVNQGPGMPVPLATCKGSGPEGEGAGQTNFFKKGIVDAVNAVTLKP